MLPFAKKILSDTTTIQGKRLQERGFVKHLHYIFEDLKIYGKKIGVVVVEDKKKFYFLSVYKV